MKAGLNVANDVLLLIMVYIIMIVEWILNCGFIRFDCRNLVRIGQISVIKLENLQSIQRGLVLWQFCSTIIICTQFLPVFMK